MRRANAVSRGEVRASIESRTRQARGTLKIFLGYAAGVGKTTSCRHYQDTHPQVWMMTADPSTTSALRVMARLCDTLGVRELSAAARPAGI